MKLRIIILGALLWLATGTASSQVALRTNLLSDAVANATIGADVVVAPKWTLGVGGSLNAWNLRSGHYRKHWSVMPEARYWFCDALGGHFVGAHAFGGQYNVGGLDGGFSFLGTDFGKLADHRYQGWYAGLGLVYGYAWVLSRHWNIEAELGLGWAYTRYDEYPCTNCGTRQSHNHPHNYVGPTKAAINLVYVF